MHFYCAESHIEDAGLRLNVWKLWVADGLIGE